MNVVIFGKGFGALDPTQDARLHMEGGEKTCRRCVVLAVLTAGNLLDPSPLR